MKKILIGLLILNSLAFVANAGDLSTGDWYLYNGYSSKHNFSFKFPNNWQPFSLSDDIQGFGPANTEYEKLPFTIQEFEGKTYQQVIDYYYASVDQASPPETDIILSLLDDDVTGKKFGNTTLVKRGSLILAIYSNPENQDIASAVLKSLKFNDNFTVHNNFQEGYTLLIPDKLSLIEEKNILKLLTKDKKNQTVFTFEQKKNSAMNDAIEYLEDHDKKFLSSESINFHNLGEAYKTIFENEESKQVSYVIILQNNDSYILSNTNVEENYPVSSYYNDYIEEILESFEFFDLPENQNYYPFKNFSDVRDNHLNAKAVNYLVEAKIINGYSDGTFKPDSHINRAELTKIIVTTKTSSDLKDYSDCFLDVNDQWYAPYICYAKGKNWISGYKSGKFLPENPVSRAEALKIILGALFEGQKMDLELEDQTIDDLDKNDWYYYYFAFADNNELLDKQHILSKQNTYSYFPENKISRKEVAEVIYRSLQQLK